MCFLVSSQTLTRTPNFLHCNLHCACCLTAKKWSHEETEEICWKDLLEPEVWEVVISLGTEPQDQARLHRRLPLVGLISQTWPHVIPTILDIKCTTAILTQRFRASQECPSRPTVEGATLGAGTALSTGSETKTEEGIHFPETQQTN